MPIPVTSPVDSSAGLSPSFLLNNPVRDPGPATPVDPLRVAQSNLDVAKLTASFYIMVGIGNQLLADAALVAMESPTLAQTLDFAGFEVIISAY